MRGSFAVYAAQDDSEDCAIIIRTMPRKLALFVLLALSLSRLCT
jgi:hypothetical protein